MKHRGLTEPLRVELTKRIELLEQEDKFFKDFLNSTNVTGGASGVGDDNQLGTTTPRYFGALDTFIANPSNVGIGILARMIETDDTVLSAVHFKSSMMLSKVGEFQHDNPKIQEFVRTFIQRMRGPSWIESLEAQASAYAYGFSVSEILWGLNDNLQKVPLRVKTYHPSTICFEIDPYGDVTEEGIVQFVIQHGQYSNPNTFFPYFQSGFQVKNPFETPTDRLLPYRMPFVNNYGLVRIPKKKCIHHTNNSMLSFGSPYGKTPVRTAHLAWQLKVFFMKQMGIAGKRQASPFIWGTAPHNMNKVRTDQPDGSKKDLNPVQALTDILSRREQDDAVVTGPKDAGYSIEAIAATIDLNQYLDVIDHLNTYIFRAFLLPSLVMTDGSSGSRSLGDKHFQLVDRMAETDAQKFTENIIHQLIRPAIEENFGKQDDYGHFAQRPQSMEERERLSNMFVNLANAGFMRAYDKLDGEYVRSTLHLPEQEESFYVAPMPNFDPVNETEDENKSGETKDESPEET